MTTEELTAEEIAELVEKINALIDKFVEEPRRTAMHAVFERIGELYYMSPASSRTQYHYAFPGGLAKHSLNVFKNLYKLNKTFNCGFSDESMLIAGIFHDLGKACVSDLEHAYYIPNDNDWKVKNLGQKYMYNSDQGVYMVNNLRSIYILQSCGFKLKEDEFMAIFLNDGQYINENRPYGMKEPTLAVFTHMADRIACEQESGKV